MTQEEGLGLREEEEGGGGGGKGRGWQQLTCTTCGTPQSGGPFSASLNSTAASMLVQHADPCMYHNMSLWELALSSLSHHSAVLKARLLYSLTFVYTCVQCTCGVCVCCVCQFSVLGFSIFCLDLSAWYAIHVFFPCIVGFLVMFHLQKSIFEGIAQEALSECVKSLCSASGTMASKKVCCKLSTCSIAVSPLSVCAVGFLCNMYSHHCVQAL